MIQYPRIQIRASAEQVLMFYKLGGPRWLRALLNKHIEESKK